jgi:hypothetical protein
LRCHFLTLSCSREREGDRSSRIKARASSSRLNGSEWRCAAPKTLARYTFTAADNKTKHAAQMVRRSAPSYIEPEKGPSPDFLLSLPLCAQQWCWLAGTFLYTLSVCVRARCVNNKTHGENAGCFVWARANSPVDFSERYRARGLRKCFADAAAAGRLRNCFSGLSQSFACVCVCASCCAVCTAFRTPPLRT